jgi:hypothetical protein
MEWCGRRGGPPHLLGNGFGEGGDDGGPRQACSRVHLADGTVLLPPNCTNPCLALPTGIHFASGRRPDGRTVALKKITLPFVLLEEHLKKEQSPLASFAFPSCSSPQDMRGGCGLRLSRPRGVAWPQLGGVVQENPNEEWLGFAGPADNLKTKFEKLPAPIGPLVGEPAPV